MYNGTILKIKFIDSPGYGTDKDMTEWYKKIKEYIVSKVRWIRENKRVVFGV
jgi:hypothetical protein